MKSEQAIQLAAGSLLEGQEPLMPQGLPQAGAQVVHAKDVAGPEEAPAGTQEVAAFGRGRLPVQFHSEHEVDEQQLGAVSLLDSSSATAPSFFLFAGPADGNPPRAGSWIGGKPKSFRS